MLGSTGRIPEKGSISQQELSPVLLLPWEKQQREIQAGNCQTCPRAVGASGQRAGTPTMPQHHIGVGFSWPAATSENQQAPRDPTYPLVLIRRPCPALLTSPEIPHRNTKI